MQSKILPYEENLFFLINGTRSHFEDNVMWLFSSIKIWIPLAVFIIFMIIYKKSWKQCLPVLIAMILVFVLCDQLSSHIIKPLFARPRPTHYPGIMEHVRTLYNYTGGKYGFISGHATNSFGFITFTALLFKNKLYSIVAISWAVIVSYSRIYLGVHFVSDITGGMITGIIIGFFIYKLYYLFQKKSPTLTNNIYSTKRVNIMSAVMVCYIMIFSILNESIIGFFINTK
jgi:Membrane-associated phospholipid phosphatase